MDFSSQRSACYVLLVVPIILKDAPFKRVVIVIFNALQTRILVTHGISFLPKVDQIIVIKDGEISETGSFQELLNHQGAFAKFIKTYLAECSEEEDSNENEEGIEEP